jgi:two-component system, cell cycle sensor histidine kinase and response regulator CckA
MMSKSAALQGGSQMAGSQRSLSPSTAVIVTLLAAATIALATYSLRAQVSPFMLIPGAMLAFLGLVALLGFLAGLIVLPGRDTRQAFYDAVADASGNAFVVMDAQGRAVYANQSYTALAAAAGAGRLVGFDILYAGHPEFATPVYHLAQAAAKGESLHRDIRVASGSVAPGASAKEPRWLRLSVTPLGDAGQGEHVLWRLDDITGDRAHQEDAFSRLQFIITYLDNAPAGFFSTLPNGKVDYLNATLAQWLDLDLAEVQGSKITLPDLVGEATAAQLTSIAAAPGGSVTEIFRVAIKDRAGIAVPVEIVHRVDFDGNAAALPSRSMVLKRKLEGGGDDSVQLLQEFTSLAPFGIAEIDHSGEIRRANGPFFGLSKNFKQGGRLNIGVRESDREELRSAIATAAAAPGDIRHCDVVLDGDVTRAVQFSLTQLVGSRNRITVFALDKTESKSLEGQLAQSQKMQAVGQLASGIAHDFNNVLTPIIGFADLLLTKMRPTDPSFADVMNIKQNANRAANLVRQLLAFSRKQTLQPKVHSLTEAMSELGDFVGRVLGEKIELSVVHGRDLGLVMVDIHQFGQVIINLAVNARDAMTQGGKLSVKTYNLTREESETAPDNIPAAEYVVCEVTDTGTGIPKDIIDKIWEPFFSTKDVGKGTGLGLAMVYGIIKQTGGYIFCDSTVGIGTTFRIYLPRHYPLPAPTIAVREDAAAVRADFTGKGRILVVEDEDSVRAFAVRALSSRGYTVLEANSGEVGLEVIEDDKDGFELILSDVVMPELDGPSMLAELRKRGVTTKVIFMSGYAEDAFERNLENPDDFAFIQKPFTLKQLIEKVKDVMG